MTRFVYWYATQGQYFSQTYTFQDYEDIDDIQVWQASPGLSYTIGRNGNYQPYITVYGTPTTLTGYYLHISVADYSIEDFTELDISVSISAPSYTHTIAYNANGGSGSMGNTTVTDTNSGNTNVTFASNGFTAPTGYYFAGWRINNTGTVYQPGNTYPVGGNGSVTAYAYWLPNTYTVSASVSPANSGSVSGTGSYTYGSTATLVATEATGYHFVNWSDGNTSASRSFTVTGNVSLTANFAINTYTISTAVNPSGSGSVTGGGTYNYGASATLTATPASGYEFSQWSDGNTSNPRTVTVSGNATYTAQFVLEVATTNVKVNGSWVTGSVYVKVNDSWVASKKIYVKVNGSWVEGS